MSTLTLERVHFLYALLISHSIDIASHICYYMLEVYFNSTSRHGFLFSCLIQRLVTAFSMPSRDGEAPLTLEHAICAVTLSQCKAQLRKNIYKCAAVENPSQSQDPLSSEIHGTSTSTAPSDAPSSSTLAETVTLASVAAQFAYLVEKVNVQLKRTKTMVCDLAHAKTNDAYSRFGVKVVCKEIAWIKKFLKDKAAEDKRIPTTFTVVTTHPATTITGAPFVAPPSPMAPIRLSPSSSDNKESGSGIDHRASDYETKGEPTPVADS